MKLIASFYILAFLPACTFSWSDIKEINSIQEVKTIFEQATQNDLFVFDVDGVILEPEDLTTQSYFCEKPEFKKILNNFDAFIKTKKNPEEYDSLFFSKLFSKMKPQPIEQKLIENILNLQRQNIKVITLTALTTGKCGIVEKLEDVRYKHLLSLGIDLSSSFVLKSIRLDELQKTKYAAEYKTKKGKLPPSAMYYKGIICSSHYPKGVALKAFLETIGWQPKQIYFFDDRLNNVESVVQEIKKIGIKCQGFLYKAATYNRPTSDIDIEVVRFQYELMKQHDDAELISYFEAKEILEKQGKQKSLNKENMQPSPAAP
jgi:DNA-directed RNA polymerase subunit F